VPRSFAIATKEVTVAQFQEAWKELQELKEFEGPDGKPVVAFDYPAEKAPEPNCPAINVDWFKAAAYCNWLSKREGIPADQWCYSPGEHFAHRMVLPPDYLDRTGYRLPTEAEWEYACRAGTSTPFYCGETLTTDLANYVGEHTYRSEPKGVYRHATTEVGSFPPNAYGLYDMHGNVWEWCADAWHDDYSGAPSDSSIWLDRRSQLRVLRGGGWHEPPVLCSSAARLRQDAAEADDLFGFRVACMIHDH
jgi:formylglycine-generating enzyme required for sulfatase activity